MIFWTANWFSQATSKQMWKKTSNVKQKWRWEIDQNKWSFETVKASENPCLFENNEIWELCLPVTLKRKGLVLHTQSITTHPVPVGRLISTAWVSSELILGVECLGKEGGGTDGVSTTCNNTMLAHRPWTSFCWPTMTKRWCFAGFLVSESTLSQQHAASLQPAEWQNEKRIQNHNHAWKKDWNISESLL